MEVATLKHLKAATKLSEISENHTLNLHYKTQVKSFQAVNASNLSAQNEHFRKQQSVKVSAKDGKIECQFCCHYGLPKLKVQRFRQGKRLVKKSVFICQKCNKSSLPKETLPTLEPLKASRKPLTSKSDDVKSTIEKRAKKKKKDKTAGLIIPDSLQKNQSSSSHFRTANSAKLKLLLNASSDSCNAGQNSRLSKLLK